MNAIMSSDFSRKMEPVALALLGEPPEKHHDGKEWRYGTRGSLSIRIDKGTFFDNEAGVGGGTLDLIQSRAGLDKPGALQWLRDRKLIEDRPAVKPRVVATYDYLDEAGAPLFQVRRMEPKNFVQAAADGKGGWICKSGCMKAVRLAPFRLPELVAAIAEQKTIYVAEGEKGALALASLGLAATCSPGGAGKWRADYNRHFVGADVVVLPDNDPQATMPDGSPRWHPDGRPVLPGQDHAADVASNLTGTAARVRILALPNLPLKGDVFDWIAAGGSAAQLEELAGSVTEIVPAPGPYADPDTYLDAPLQPGKPAYDTAEHAARIAALLTEFNERYMVVIEAGKTTIYKPEYDPVLNRRYYDRMSFTDLRNAYLNRVLVVGANKDATPIYKKAADIWLEHKNRRQFLGGVTFDPSGKHVRHDMLNLWKSFGVVARPGKWERMKRHIYTVLCGERQELYDYVMNWMARLVQFPALQGEVAVVMRGGEGSGKGTIARALRHILGQHGMAISNSKHLTGNFNGHLRDCVFLFADEAFYAGDPSQVGALKSIITEPYLTIEAKHQNAVQMPNFVHLMMASNEEWVVPASLDSRRFLVLEASDAHANDHAYFGEIWKEMEAGGYEGMLCDLLHHDLTGFNVRRVPMTEGLQEQRKLSMGTRPEAWWADVLHRGYVWKSRYGLEAYFGEWHDMMTTEVLFDAYTDFAKTKGERHPLAREAFGRFIASMGAIQAKPRNAVVGERIADVQTNFGTSRKAELVKKDRATGYRLGTLTQARAAFDKATGLKTAWPDDGDNED